MESLWVLVLFYIVEGALVGYVGMALIGIRLNPKQFAVVGLCQGLVVYVVRGIYTMNGLPFGTHILFNLLGLIIILCFVTRTYWGVCTAGGLLGFIVIFLSEMSMLPPVYSYLKITFEKVWADTGTHIVMGYVGDWLLILIALVLFFTKKSLVHLKDIQK